MRTFDKTKHDISAIFLTFMALMGDSEKTALAFDIEPASVEALAEDEGWREKIRRVSLMSKSGKPGDFERAQNRALCFVQAHQLRQQVDRLLKECAGMTDEELVARSCVRTRDGGTQLSAKFLVDLTSAAEACHRMSFAALNDTASERMDRGTDGQEGKTGDLHLAIVAALSNPAATMPAKPLLLEETASKVHAIAERESSDRSGPTT
jgi:hypothetical protein